MWCVGGTVHWKWIDFRPYAGKSYGLWFQAKGRNSGRNSALERGTDILEAEKPWDAALTVCELLPQQPREGSPGLLLAAPALLWAACSKFNCAATCAQKRILQSMTGLSFPRVSLSLSVQKTKRDSLPVSGSGIREVEFTAPILNPSWEFLVLKQFFQKVRWWPSAALGWEESLKNMIITVFTNVTVENLISTCTSFLKLLPSCSLSFSVQAKRTTRS